MVKDKPIQNNDSFDEAAQVGEAASIKLSAQANSERRAGAPGDRVAINDLVAQTGDASKFDTLKSADDLGKQYGRQIALFDKGHQEDLTGACDWHISRAVNEDHAAALRQYKAAFENQYA